MSPKIWVPLVIVFAVIVLCAGGLIFSVGQIRMAAAETVTRNNMKQCALAVHNYHDTYRKMPPGFNVGGMYINENKSVWFHLLPYVEADNVYKAGKNDAIIPPFILPSDPSMPNPEGTVSMAVNLRVFAFETLGADTANREGVAFPAPKGKMVSGLTMKDLSKGQITTIMLTTRYGNCDGSETRYAADAYGDNLGRGAIGGFMGAGASTKPPTASADSDAAFQTRPTKCVSTAGVFGHSFPGSKLFAALCDGSVTSFDANVSPGVFAKALCPGVIPSK